MSYGNSRIVKTTSIKTFQYLFKSNTILFNHTKINLSDNSYYVNCRFFIISYF